MRLCSHIKFDLTIGLFKRGMWVRYIIWFSIFALFSLEFTGSLTSLELSQYTYGDYLLYIFGGMREYIPAPGEPFQIPYLWLINHIGILYFTLHYMHDDLEGFGQQMILRSGSRTAWWLSKCIWNTAVVVLLYSIAWGTVFLFACANHAVWSFEISSFMAEFMVIGQHQIPGTDWPITLEITFLPLLVTLAISQLQMLLCLIVRPIISYVVSIVLFIASAYYLSPALLGNYAMALRSNKIVSNGVSQRAGVWICFTLILIGIVLGSIIFTKYNILGKED